jgi:hypothetical protein
MDDDGDACHGDGLTLDGPSVPDRLREDSEEAV